jgi:hypothetical protein
MNNMNTMNTNFTNTTNQLDELQKTKDSNFDFSIIEVDLENNFNLLESKIDIITDVNDNVTKSISTNDRKSFYESQQYDYLVTWNTRLWYFYYLVAIILIFILFFSKNVIEFNYKIAASVGLIIYPFTISYLLIPVVYLFNFIYGLIPKNVYNSL